MEFCAGFSDLLGAGEGSALVGAIVGSFVVGMSAVGILVGAGLGRTVAMIQ